MIVMAVCLLAFVGHIFALLPTNSKLFIGLTVTNYPGHSCVDHTMPARTKKTQGRATPLPHILYSAESECGDCSQLTIWFLVLGLVAVPMILR